MNKILRIIAVAFDFVRRNGWQALTPGSLAERLGTSPRPIYSFFSSVAALGEEVVKKSVGFFHGYMTRERTGDPWHDHGVGYVMFAMEEKALSYKRCAPLLCQPFKITPSETFSSIQPLDRGVLCYGMSKKWFLASNDITGEGRCPGD